MEELKIEEAEGGGGNELEMKLTTVEIRFGEEPLNKDNTLKHVFDTYNIPPQHAPVFHFKIIFSPSAINQCRSPLSSKF